MLEGVYSGAGNDGPGRAGTYGCPASDAFYLHRVQAFELRTDRKAKASTDEKPLIRVGSGGPADRVALEGPLTWRTTTSTRSGVGAYV
jgi:hypothetical protein